MGDEGVTRKHVRLVSLHLLPACCCSPSQHTLEPPSSDMNMTHLEWGSYCHSCAHRTMSAALRSGHPVCGSRRGFLPIITAPP